GVRYVAVAGSPEPIHAVDVSAVMDRAVESLAAHDAYLTALGDHPMAQPREFLAWWPSSTGPGSAAGRPRCSRCSVAEPSPGRPQPRLPQVVEDRRLHTQRVLFRAQRLQGPAAAGVRSPTPPSPRGRTPPPWTGRRGAR